MSSNQWGWFLFIVGLLVIVALLIGDVWTLVQSHGAVDMAFVTGMIAHVTAVLIAFKGGKMILPSESHTVSDEKRAELLKG